MPKNDFSKTGGWIHLYMCVIPISRFSRMRQFVSKNPSKGPFSGIRAIIHTSEHRKGAFQRLIWAGKGVVIEDAKPPYVDAKGQ